MFRTWLAVLLLPLLLAAACDKGGEAESAGESTTHTLDALNLTVRAPGNWAFRDRGAEGLSAASWSIGAGMDGVIIRHFPDRPIVASLDEARERYPMSGSTIHEATAIEGGGYYLYYETDFGGMMLPAVHTVFPWPDGGTVECEIQLQPGQDPSRYREICSSVRPAGG